MPLNNHEKDIRLANIDKKRSATLGLILQNRLLSKLSCNFWGMIFIKFKCPTHIPVLNIRNKHLRYQNNNLFYLFCKKKFAYTGFGYVQL